MIKGQSKRKSKEEKLPPENEQIAQDNLGENPYQAAYPEVDKVPQDYNSETTFVQESLYEQPAEEPAELIDIRSVLEYEEEIPKNSSQIFAKNLVGSIRICQFLMCFLGRFPLMTHKSGTSHYVEFQFTWVSIRAFTFAVTFFVLVSLTLVSSLCFGSIMLDVPRQPRSLDVSWENTVEPSGAIKLQPVFVHYPKRVVASGKLKRLHKTHELLRAEEMFIFKRNAAAVLIVIFMMYHIIISDFNLLYRHKDVAAYMTLWTRSVEIMKIDSAFGARKYTCRLVVYYICWFIIFCLAIALNIAPVGSGASLSFAITWIRMFYPPIHAMNDTIIKILRACGGAVYLYVVLCSKVYVLFFLYICKMLRTTCEVWNERLEIAFTPEGRRASREKKCETRTGYDHLFKDYVTILDLIGGADKVFTNVIESYLVCTVTSLVIEIYYLMRPLQGHNKDFDKARVWDAMLIGLNIANTFMTFHMVIIGGAKTGESYSNGLDIIRRQGLIGQRSEEELHFLLSLHMSYAGHFNPALTAGGFINMDKSLLVTIIGAVVAFTVALFQFSPPLELTNVRQKAVLGIFNRKNSTQFKQFLTHVEATFYYFEHQEPIK